MATNSRGNSVTKTVSMAAQMGMDADVRAKSLGFRSFSAYVQNLIRNDLMEGGNLTLKETPTNSGPVTPAEVVDYLAKKKAKTPKH